MVVAVTVKANSSGAGTEVAVGPGVAVRSGSVVPGCGGVFSAGAPGGGHQEDSRQDCQDGSGSASGHGFVLARLVLAGDADHHTGGWPGCSLLSKDREGRRMLIPRPGIYTGLRQP